MASFIDPRRVLSTPRTEAMVCLQRTPFVVYAICDPVTDLPVYVGQTQNIVSRSS
ncbi:GIY-YIG nuclease family protein [Aureimonas ureilytica]|uniref:GIY-YIG nuclease family protein n=1 Tax=Aureimonas ureilytica TaxID=401562 RepID=UPI000AB143AD|nr:GIY-YIG nuclease family protein [Aureimonas ureilytica]